MDENEVILEGMTNEDKVFLVKEGIKSQAFIDIKKQLLETGVAELPGLGSLCVSSRKVKNDDGRNFAVTVRLQQNKEFSKELVEEYAKFPEKFNKN